MAHVSPWLCPCRTVHLVALYRLVFYRKGRVLKLYKISSFNLSVVDFSCQSCCSSKSFSHFWNTRSLVTAAEWSVVVSHLSSTLFLKYLSLSRQICIVFDVDPTFGCFQLDCQYTELACWISGRKRTNGLFFTWLSHACFWMLVREHGNTRMYSRPRLRNPRRINLLLI